MTLKSDRFAISLKERIVYGICYITFVLSPILFLYFLFGYFVSKKESALAICCIIFFFMIYSGFICHSIYIKSI